jgi:hypothetical protein
VLLREFARRLQVLDLNRDHCLIEGSIDMSAGGDTSRNVRALPYLYCRSGKDFYCRLGDAETIHLGTQNIFIRNDLKRVVLSSRTIKPPSPLAGAAALLAYLKNESYRLRSVVSGSSRTIRLVNEYHLACKELSLTYDTLSGKAERIETRSPDPGDPYNTKRDRTVTLHIRHTSASGNPRHYRAPGDILRRQNGKWTLTGRFAGYQLTLL